MYGDDRASELHTAKNEVYLRIAKDLVRPTPLVELFKRCPGAILTGASEAACHRVLQIIGLIGPDAPFRAETIVSGLTLVEKVAMLKGMDAPGIYFDDDIDAVKKIHKEVPGWTTMLAKF
jgi:hypothetical protein